MMDGKALSKMIRMRKKNSLRPDMDDAGQEAIDPVAAWDMKQAAEIDDVLGDPTPSPPSAREMGEDDSSQSLEKRKRISARLAKYFDSL